MGESKIVRLMAVLCLCTAMVACGDSDSSDDGGDPDAGGGAGGTGGTGGSGGSGGTGGGGASMCGGDDCADLSVAMGFIETCCTPSDECSIKLPTGTGCPEPAEADECGTWDVIPGVSFPRCCMDDGMCGVNIDHLAPGGGCMSPEQLMDTGMLPIPVPEKSCGGDAGADDAGL